MPDALHRAPLVFVVQDDTEAREELVDRLLAHGFAVAAYPHEDAARAASARHRPDLVLIGTCAPRRR